MLIPLRKLINWGLRRKVTMPVKGSRIRFCPVCNKRIKYHMGMSQARHFGDCHKEYEFKGRTCTKCQGTFHTFQELAEKHRHEEGK
jgi:hypothetical protein